jgi:hypothetical protein
LVFDVYCFLHVAGHHERPPSTGTPVKLEINHGTTCFGTLKRIFMIAGKMNSLLIGISIASQIYHEIRCRSSFFLRSSKPNKGTPVCSDINDANITCCMTISNTPMLGFAERRTLRLGSFHEPDQKSPDLSNRCLRHVHDLRTSIIITFPLYTFPPQLELFLQNAKQDILTSRQLFGLHN